MRLLWKSPGRLQPDFPSIEIGAMIFHSLLLSLLSVWSCFVHVDHAAAIPSPSPMAHGDFQSQPLPVRLGDQRPRHGTDRRLSRRVIEQIVHSGFQSFLEIGNDWNMYYSSWNGMAMPVAPAAWALTALYAHFQTQARTTWRKQLPQKVLSGAMGAVQLTMICPEQGIPWDFVEKFSTQLLDITAKGWTGMFFICMLSRPFTVCAHSPIMINLRLDDISPALAHPRCR